MAKREPFDLKSPEARALRDEIVHGTFIREGTMVAFPLCFPGDSTPIVADESHITALDVAPNWMVYGGTGGRQAHLFVGTFHGATGMVLDLGTVEGATECVAICCGQRKFVAFANGPGGGRAVARALEGLPFDLLQEWGFSRQPFEDLGEVVPGERVVHAVGDPSRTRVVGATERHLFTLGFDGGKADLVGEVEGLSRLAVTDKGRVVGLDDGHALWRFDPASRALERHAIPLPDGSWDAAPLRWARDPVDGALYTADGAGSLFSFREDGGFRGPLGRAPLTPVGPMAVTFDGRLFGACGAGICKLFAYCPDRQEVTTLGCAVSVLERRRYGYQFGDTVTGRDGQLFFGEDDDLGHLWMYFPAIPRRPGAPAPQARGASRGGVGSDGG